VDFRLGDDGRPYLLEINTLPGLNPTVSDLCIMARAEGMHYTDLINEIVYLAADRYAQESSQSMERPMSGRNERVHAFSGTVWHNWAAAPVGGE